MSSDSKTPDLVQRAAARLGGAPKAKSPDLGIVGTAAVQTSAALNSSPPIRRDPEPSRGIPQARHVTVSPTSLAANGISLPSTGFVRTVEEFRVIKRQILANVSRAPAGPGSDFNRVIMITSAKPGDGKTYTAINLALSIAFERDLKVLLVDADVYRQSMLNYFGIKAETGWIDLLSEPDLTFSDVLLHTNIANLTILPAGKPRTQIPELMSSRKMTHMVTEMARRYPDRFIIFDTLPCLVSSEPAILATMAGQTIFVVAAHDTSRDQIESSLRLISGCPSVSLILNKAEPVLAEQFGNYYRYGYNYQQK